MLTYKPIPTADLIPYARNSRTHSDAQVAKIASSIREFGFLNPVVTDGKNGIVAGHGRVLAASKLGLREVPCVEASHLTEAQKRAYVIADNRMALDAGWDIDLLKIELGDLQGMDFDLSLTGFDPGELGNLLADKTEGLTDEDAVPESPARAVTVLGDVWVLGKHRVMCGDSTSIEQAEMLMGGVNADLVFTDPPYNVAYEGRGEKNKLGPIKNDNMSAESFEQFCLDVFSTFHAVMKPLACIYVCHPDSQTAPKLAFERTFGELFKKASTIIWVKQSAGMGWQDYRAQHEPILYGWKEGGSGKHFYCGDRTKTTIWQIGRDAQASYVHPTQKPVALPEEAIKNSSKGEDIVLDLFGGSGSTLIACEKSGRVNRSMELDPKYCDVIVKRWQEFTGQKATLESSGQTFDDVATSRYDWEKDASGSYTDAIAEKRKKLEAST
jgi:DNA modification methylase